MSKKAPGEYGRLDHSGAEDPDPPPHYTSQTVSLEVDNAPPQREGPRVFESDHDPLPPEPRHYLVWSVLTTVVCCWVCGFIAVVMGLLVGQRYNRRDYPAAKRFSRRAKICAILSCVCGVGYIIGIAAYWSWWYQQRVIAEHEYLYHASTTAETITTMQSVY